MGQKVALVTHSANFCWLHVAVVAAAVEDDDDDVERSVALKKRAFVDTASANQRANLEGYNSSGLATASCAACRLVAGARGANAV